MLSKKEQRSTVQSPLSRFSGPQKPEKKSGSVASVFTLARWQLGSTWRLLLVAELGVLAAVVLICLIPLYSSVALSAALRDSLSASPENFYITETGFSAVYNRQKLQQFQQTVSQQMGKIVPGYVENEPIFSASMPSLAVPNSETILDFTGFPEQQIPQHVRLVEGQLPKTSRGVLEFVTTPEGLEALEQMHQGYRVGSVFQFPLFLHAVNLPPLTLTLLMKDVGVVTLTSKTDTFWHALDFQPSVVNATTSIPALISNEALGSALERIEMAPGMQTYTLTPSQFITVSWYYPLKLEHFDVNHLDDITTRMNQLLSAFNLAGDPLSLPPYVQQTSTLGPIQIFHYYSDRVTLLQVPVGSVALLLGGLILFFVSSIAGLLIEQQGEQIAFLRSRGATRGQLVGALSAQAGLLALPVLALGPVLACELAVWLSGITLQGNDRTAVNVLLSQPVAAMLSVGWIALVVVVVALLVLAFALFQKLRTNVLTRRQEATRAPRSALWERWRLDLVGTAAALVGTGFAFYLANAGILDARTRALVLPIVMLGAFLGILVASLLLLFRFFPMLLRWAARLAQRGRGATAMLAIAQMARAPWQAARLTLLLTFTLAFAIFTLTFNASQAQRIADSTEFQVGSDFSGVLTGPGSVADWLVTEQGYAQIPGVQSATIGHVGIMGSSNEPSIDVQAVDASTCAQTMYWGTSGSAQEVAPLLQQLVVRRQASIAAQLVPAIVDASAVQSLGLVVGSRFSLRDANGVVNFVTLGIVRSIPSIVDSGGSAGTSDTTITGGVLADYATFAAVQIATNGQGDEAESIWLKTSNDPAAIASVRRVLSSGQWEVNALSDQRAIVASLAYDPLESMVQGGALAGTIVALMLGLIGSLLGSWTSARKRVVSFAMMRALGNTSGQIVGIVLWEQGIIYALALVGGIGGGLLFGQMVTPGLLYASVINVGITQPLSAGTGLNFTGTGELYLVQGTPVAHIVIPIGPVLALIGIAIIVSTLALLIIVRLVVRQTLGEILRLNED